MNRKAIFFILLFFLVFFNLSADERTKNIDVYLVLDKSLSMEEEIGSVKAYTINNLIKNLLIPGDTFTLIPFYGKAHVVFSGKITSRKDKIKLEKTVESIQANGHFTDIGNALDTLKKSLSRKSSTTRRKYVLLITDGKQEAPPGSKYYSPDHTFNHEFLKNVKIIQRKGWKIEILGIGTESAARKLAKELSVSYAEVPQKASSKEISKKIGNFLGTIRIERGSCTLQKLTSKGNGILVFTLASEGYRETRSITVSGIRLQAENIRKDTILLSPVTLSIPPHTKKKIELPVTVPVLKKGYTAEIIFTFDSGTTFLPPVQKIHINTVVNNTLLLYSIIAAVVIGIVFFIVTGRHRLQKKDDNENDRKKDG